MKNIPLATVERVAKYLRCLKYLGCKNVKVISSKDLAEHTKVTPEQVRKDFSYFGKFGKTGTGYNVKKLIKKLEKVLKSKSTWNTCIIGAGSLGHALTNYPGFKKSGFNIVALFDNDPEKIGEKISSTKIYDIKKFSQITKKKDIEITIVAVPESAREEIERTISKSKIRGVLNFAPVTLNIKSRRKISTVDVDLSQKLYILSFLMTKGKRR